jgi:SpoVK/Ycf46/Vps4 family AAA+-type ATPase
MDEYLTLAREQWELNKILLNTSCHICFYGPPATGKT